MPSQDPSARAAVHQPAEMTAEMTAATAAPRPESLLLAFFGAQLAGRQAAIAASSVIGLLGQLGVGEHASRATLKRMTQRQLLRTIRAGRQAYLTLTPHAETVLHEGRTRLEAGTVNREWDGRWTLLAFSVPEDRRENRHALRTQLAWAGFGLLQNALWIAPSPGDIAGPLAAHGLLQYVKIFRAEAVTPGDPRLLAAEAWDLPGLARGYQEFLSRWDDPPARAPDELSRQVLLEAEWLLLIRADPRLPLALLPGNWPGVRAERVFRDLSRDTEAAARRLAATLDWMPLP